MRRDNSISLFFWLIVGGIPVAIGATMGSKNDIATLKGMGIFLAIIVIFLLLVYVLQKDREYKEKEKRKNEEILKSLKYIKDRGKLDAMLLLEQQKKNDDQAVVLTSSSKKESRELPQATSESTDDLPF